MSRMTWREFDRDPSRHRIHVHLDAIRRRLNRVLRETEGVNFDVALLPDDPITLRELLIDSLAELRARLDEMDARFRR